jgi:hypothetical protein
LGEDLVINGDYLANGIRERASERATLELGPVTEIEQTRKLSAEIDGTASLGSTAPWSRK